MTQGTIPFMAIDLLQEYTRPGNNFTHNFSHDLESLVYVLVWVCVLYQAPNEIRSDQTIEQTCLKQWALAKTPNNIQALCDQKMGQLSSRSVLSDFTPYFEPLKPTVTRLYELVQLSRDSREKNCSQSRSCYRDSHGYFQDGHGGDLRRDECKASMETLAEGACSNEI